MKTLFALLFLFTMPPLACLSQTSFPGHKKLSVGGFSLDIHGPGLSFGTVNPMFLVPIDTTGDLILTGTIRGVKVIGRFAPYAYGADSVYAENPLDRQMTLILDSVYRLQKHGEWDYFYADDLCYHEYFDNGTLIRRDEPKYFFTNDRKGITVGDSTARIRSIIDLYLKKGSSENR